MRLKLTTLDLFCFLSFPKDTFKWSPPLYLGISWPMRSCTGHARTYTPTLGPAVPRLPMYPIPLQWYLGYAFHSRPCSGLWFCYSYLVSPAITPVLLNNNSSYPPLPFWAFCPYGISNLAYMYQTLVPKWCVASASVEPIQALMQLYI